MTTTTKSDNSDVPACLPIITALGYDENLIDGFV